MFKAKLLVTDDEPEFLNALKTGLEWLDYTVHTASNGEEALKVLDTYRVDILITDLRMPGMDGLELVERAKSRFGNLRFIIITGHGEMGDAIGALNLGVGVYLMKPPDLEELDEKIKTLEQEIQRQIETEAMLRSHRDQLEVKVKERTAQLQERETHLQAIFDNALDAIIITDDRGLVEEFNRTAERLFGISRADAIGREIADLIMPPHHRRTLGKLLLDPVVPAEELSRAGRRIDLPGLHADGKIIDLEVGLTGFSREGHHCHMAFIHDISERKQLLRSLEEALEAAQSANRAKSEFLANMSHEIRTPMNAITGYVGLALDSDLPAEARDFFTRINWASQTLLRVINDILDFSKIEAGKLMLEPAPFDLLELCDVLTVFFRRDIVEKNLEMNLWVSDACPTGLIGDATRLKQILINLLSNAIKFTDRGEIAIKVEPTRLSPDRVRLEFAVRDTGIGMSPQRMSRLFLPFEQGDGSTTRKQGGSGLGLSICKRLVEMMNGSFKVRSEPGIGSDIRFTAEFGRSERAESRRMIVPECFRDLRVLVMDDNETARGMLVEALHAFQFKVVAATLSFRDTWEELRVAAEAGESYDLLLLDQRMPDGGGEKTVQRLFESLSAVSPATPFPKIILLTVQGGESVHRPTEGWVWLSKPICRSSLFDAIMSVIGQEVADPQRNGCDAKNREAEKRLTIEQRIGEKIGGARVLLVEDNTLNRDIARAVMEKAGLIVEEVDNGRDAIHMVGRTHYDAVLMDIQMPDMDGFETTRRIRRDRRRQNIPIIALTAHTLKGDRERCLNAGMNDHVAKPIDTGKLFSVLEKQIDPATLTRPAGRVAPPIEPAAGSREPLPFTLDGIDMRQAMKRFMNDQAVFKSMFLKIGSHQRVVEEIRAALGKGDTERAFHLVHSIKGMAGNLAAEELHRMAIALERRIMSGEGEPVVELARFEEAFQRILVMVQGLESADRDPPPSTTTAPVAEGTIDGERVKPLVRKLSQLLEKRDMAALSTLTSLKEALAGAGVQTELRRLEEFVFNIDFSNARTALEGLARRLSIPC